MHKTIEDEAPMNIPNDYSFISLETRQAEYQK